MIRALLFYYPHCFSSTYTNFMDLCSIIQYKVHNNLNEAPSIVYLDLYCSLILYLKYKNLFINEEVF